MKLLALILSVYFFALNLVPCEDTVVLDNDVKTEISQALDNDHQHQGADLCSPFCQCHCCHIHATHFKIADFTIAIAHISTEVFYYADGLIKNFNPNILQPPQV